MSMRCFTVHPIMCLFCEERERSTQECKKVALKRCEFIVKKGKINNYWPGWGFCDIRNNQGRGKCYQAKPKAEADNTNRDLDYFGYHKNRIHSCFIIHCFKENNDKLIIAPNTVYFRQAMFLRELDIALGNHALRAQPTD